MQCDFTPNFIGSLLNLRMMANAFLFVKKRLSALLLYRSVSFGVLGFFFSFSALASEPYYPMDNDSEYIEYKGRPKLPSNSGYYPDHYDNRRPAAPIPRDNDADYEPPKGYKNYYKGDDEGAYRVVPNDNDSDYVPPKSAGHADENMDFYPLYYQ